MLWLLSAIDSSNSQPWARPAGYYGICCQVSLNNDPTSYRASRYSRVADREQGLCDGHLLLAVKHINQFAQVIRVDDAELEQYYYRLQFATWLPVQ